MNAYNDHKNNDDKNNDDKNTGNDNDNDAFRDFDVMNDGTPVRYSQLQIGDVLCVRSSGALADLCCLIDGAEFDHTMIVTGFDNDGIPLVSDEAFRGFRTIRLVDYENQPVSVLVRRHRIAGAGDRVAEQALAFGAQHPHFALDRLGQIIVLSLVRIMPRLQQFPAESAARFLDRLNALFVAAERTVGRTDTAVCADVLFAGHDILASSTDPTSAYLGLVLPRRGVGGLILWAQSAQAFADFVDAQIEERTVNPPTDSFPATASPEHLLVKLEWALYRDADLSLPFEDEHLGTDESLRASIFGSMQVLARLLGVSTDQSNGEVGPTPVNVMAMYVLHRLLDQRVVVSARDIIESRSLRTVGRLDVLELDWARPLDPRSW